MSHGKHAPPSQSDARAAVVPRPAATPMGASRYQAWTCCAVVRGSVRRQIVCVDGRAVRMWAAGVGATTCSCGAHPPALAGGRVGRTAKVGQVGRGWASPRPARGIGFVAPSPEQSEGLGNQGSISRYRLPISKTSFGRLSIREVCEGRPVTLRCFSMPHCLHGNKSQSLVGDLGLEHGSGPQMDSNTL